MVFDFSFYNPTTIHFGKESIDKLKDELSNYGPKILLMYGKSSIKKIGLYDKVMTILKESGKEVIELSGVMPNPTYDKMMEGATLVKENDVDLILAVGGGSVIDCAKGVAVSAYSEEEPFAKFWLGGGEVTHKTVPVGSILTMVGTGSEMNGGSVITHEAMKAKIGRVFGPDQYPKFSILDPTLTFSVPKYQMVSGIFDIMSHLMEQYFSPEENNTSDYLIEGLLKSVIDNAKIAIDNPEDYAARSNIMWSATLALNTLVGASKVQDWKVHMIEHQLGAFTDCAHGMGLAAVSMPYYRKIYKSGLSKFVRFATEVWGISLEGKTDDEIALAGIDALEQFAKEAGIVLSISELGATKEMLQGIADTTPLFPSGYQEITKEDVLEILEACF